MVFIGTLVKTQSENDMEYLWRVCMAKDSGETDKSWQEIADILNHELCEDESEYKGEAAWRKSFQYAKMFYDAGVFASRTDSSDYVREVNEAKQKLYMEKTKVRDERNELSRLLREQARRETFLELVKETFVSEAKPVSKNGFLEEVPTDNELIIHLTDVHAGLGIDNYLNTYDENVLHERLCEYYTQIKKIRDTHKANVCTLVLGGDLISGIIHTSIRLENTVNAIQQVKLVCVYLTEFIRALREIFTFVTVCSVSGNHSRVSPNKEDHLSGEDFDSLVPFYIETAFSNDSSVTVMKNDVCDYIATFEVCGHKWVAVHGDNDVPSKVTDDMTRLLGEQPDGILMGHRHTNEMTTCGFTKVVQSGSVCGTDRYAFDRRLFGNPEQVVIVSDKYQAVKCLYNVDLS